MPFTFVYVLALFAYLGVALVVLVAALLLALVPKLRSRAKWLALGVLGSVVGVFTFQLATLPVVLATIGTLMVPVALFHGGGHTTNLVVILISLATVLVATALFALASLAGLVTGWKAANALGEGIALRTFFASNRLVEHFSALRPYRLPLLLWLAFAWAAFAAMSLA